jgi:hypothetical protein
MKRLFVVAVARPLRTNATARARPICWLNAAPRPEAKSRRDAGDTLMDIARSYNVNHREALGCRSQ